MPSQAAQFDLSTSFLDQPDTLAYGLVRGAGNKILQHVLTDNTRVAFYILGKGRWDSLLRLWINNLAIALPSANVHFHPGDDGEIGNGLAAVSTGGDQHVDSFFSLIPGGLDPVTFSRYAWLALKVPPDPGAPTADLTVLADYQAMQVRQFDASGNQTAFSWSQNPAWWICDFLINKFVLREGKINQPLLTAELARFDWASFAAAATYCDAVLAGGQKRFSDGGVVFLNGADTADKALEQMLLMCRGYLLERSGKLSLYIDQPRASIFTFTSDNIAAGSFKAYKSNLRGATNRLTPTFRDLSIASGSSDDATRFAIASDPQVNHEAHQRAVGARGAGLSVIPKITELALDLGVNTPERVWRILDAMLVRQLGDDVDANGVYNAPFRAEWTGFEDSLAVEPGDVVTIDPSISEEYGGKLFEVMEASYDPAGPIDYVGLEYMPNAFPDVAPTQQVLEAPIPGTGLASPLVLDPNNNLAVDPSAGSTLAKGSIPLAFFPGLTYSATTTSITWSWNFTGANVIRRTDVAGSTISLNSSQAVTGLSSGTSYNFYPYYDEPSAAFAMVTTGGTGTPAWAHSGTNRAWTTEQGRQDHLPLSLNPVAASTTSAGTGGGSGGGDSGCHEVGVLVREKRRGVIRIEDVEDGDELCGENLTVRVLSRRIADHDLWIVVEFTNGAIIPGTAGHPWPLAEKRGEVRRSCDLCLQDAVRAGTGIAYPVVIRFEKRISKKVSLECSAPHEFFVSDDGKRWVLSHNLNTF